MKITQSEDDIFEEEEFITQCDDSRSAAETEKSEELGLRFSP